MYKMAFSFGGFTAVAGKLGGMPYHHAGFAGLGVVIVALLIYIAIDML